MIKDQIEKAMALTLHESDIASLKNEDEEYVFRKVVTTSNYGGTLKLLDFNLDPNTEFYAEGFQVNSQLCGTFAKPQDIGRFSDDANPFCHTPVEEYRTAHNMLLLKDKTQWTLIGFSSAQKYTGYFHIYPNGGLEVYMSLEGKRFGSGDVIESEYFVILENSDKKTLLEQFSELIRKHIKALKLPKAVTGWSSRYAFKENLNENSIIEAAKIIRTVDRCDIVCIDDGYEKHFGDWLDFSEGFKNGLIKSRDAILEHGKIPGIFIAPFIASGSSVLLKEHPDWFATDIDGNLIPAGYVSYGGWRDTPWYVLDFAVTEAAEYISSVLRQLSDLGFRYFRLDGCYCGAIKGLLFRNNSSRIENYKKGLLTVLHSVSEDSIIEVCNAPVWPSLGLVHAFKVSDELENDPLRIRQIAFESFNRIWMNRRLWLNDSDCLCIKKLSDLKDKRCLKLNLATAMVGSGCMMLGDSPYDLDEKIKALASKISKYMALVKDVTYNDEFSSFTISFKGRKETVEIYINWTDSVQEIMLSSASDFISGAALPSSNRLESGDVLIALKA